MDTSLTLFSWGYEGWGNAVPELLSVTERVERQRGFKPPLFVDVRFRRAVRAVGFREKALEVTLGPDRYRWMKSLGNANIGDQTADAARIAEPEAVNKLIDLALAAQAENRRIIFFCSCNTIQALCHRHEVASLTLAAARRRNLPLTIVEWPGGEPNTTIAAKVPLTPSLLKALTSETQNVPWLPIEQSLVDQAAGWPWGTQVLAEDETDKVLLGVGPAKPRAGKWLVPILACLSWDNADANAELHQMAMGFRKTFSLLPRASIPRQASSAVANKQTTAVAQTGGDVQIFHSKLDPGAHAGFQLWRRAHPNGHYLTLDKQQSGRIHRVECRHLADVTWDPADFRGDLAKKCKICSTSLRTLEAWASEHQIATRFCRDCDLP